MSPPTFANSPSTVTGRPSPPACTSSISIASTWRSVRVDCTAAQVQTSPVSFTSSACGPDPPVNINCQTDPGAGVLPIGSAAAARSAEPTDAAHLTASRAKLFDLTSLAAFVQTVEPALSEMLMENLQSPAFDDWPPIDPLALLDQDASDGAGALSSPNGLLTLSDTFVSDSQCASNGQSLVATQRSKSGSSLILAYGHLHGKEALGSPWCTHTAHLAVILNSAKRMAHVQLNACPTTLAVHPEHTNLVAVGTWPGDVLVWDSNVQDAASSISVASVPAALAHLGHADAVAKVVWVPGSAGLDGVSGLAVGQGGMAVAGGSGLWSAGTDGSVIEWRYISAAKDPARLDPVRRTTVAVPMTSSTRANASSSGLGMPLRSLAVHSDPMVGTTMLLVGSDVGHVGHVDARRMRAIADTSAMDAGNAAVMAPHFKYTSHAGAVNAIEVNPFISTLFVSVGQDGKALVHRLFKDTPLLTIRPVASSIASTTPLLSAAWSPLRPGLLAVASTDSVYLITVCGPDRGAVVAQLAVPCTGPLVFHPTLPLLYVGVIDGGSSGMRVVRLAASVLKLGDMEVRTKEVAELTRFVGGSDGVGDE